VAGVATCIVQWLSIIRIPHILQCDNGVEFKGVLLILLWKYGIKIIHGRTRHSQSQGLVKQANGVVKSKLRCWLADHEGQGWSDALPDIALGMNRQIHSVTKKMPYEVFLIRHLDGKNELLQLQIFKLIKLRKHFSMSQKKRLLMTRYDLGPYIIF